MSEPLKFGELVWVDGDPSRRGGDRGRRGRGGRGEVRGLPVGISAVDPGRAAGPAGRQDGRRPVSGIRNASVGAAGLILAAGLMALSIWLGAHP